MTHLTFSQIELSWMGGGCKHSHFLTSWRSVPGGNSGNICSVWGDKEGGRERAPDSRTQGEVGLHRGFAGYLEEDGSALGVLATGMHRN